jgi:hypothetical protein
MRSLTVILTTAALALAGCGGDEGGEQAAAVPQGFKELAGDGWSLAHPSDWQVTQSEAGPLAQGPKGTGGLAPQAGVARDPQPPPFDLALEAFNADQTLKRAKRNVTRDEAFELDGAEEARLIEADYLERTSDTATTPVKTIDVLVRTEDGAQLDFLLRAPRADFDRARLDEVLDTIRLR